MKVRIISPVHIGTGNENLSFQYMTSQNKTCYYNLYELLSTLPAKELVNEDFLNSINSTKKSMTNISKKIKYDIVEPKYYLSCMAELSYDNVFEQIKNLNKPIIPGSTLKGAIISSVCYTFLKCHITMIKDYEKIKFEDLIETVTKSKELLRDISSNITCLDVQFNNLAIYNAKRATKKTTISIGYQETISKDQEYIGDFYHFSSEKLKKYTSEIQKELISMFEKENVAKSINSFTIDALNEDNSVKMQKYYEETNLINLQNDVKKYIKMANDISNNHCLLRIGKDTNYNFKGSIALLYKTKKFDQYKKNFERYFKPIRNAKVNANTIPSTRTFFCDEDSNYLEYPGFVELFFDD